MNRNTKYKLYERSGFLEIRGSSKKTKNGFLSREDLNQELCKILSTQIKKQGWRDFQIVFYCSGVFDFPVLDEWKFSPVCAKIVCKWNAQEQYGVIRSDFFVKRTNGEDRLHFSKSYFGPLFSYYCSVWGPSFVLECSTGMTFVSLFEKIKSLLDEKGIIVAVRLREREFRPSDPDFLVLPCEAT